MRYRDGVHDSARLIRREKKGNWKGYFQDVGVSLSPSLEGCPWRDVSLLGWKLQQSLITVLMRISMGGGWKKRL